MITNRVSTDQILERLNRKVASRDPIMISSAGSGLVAKLREAAGADCINTFSGARLRANGMGTMSMMWPILDSNRQTLDYTREDIMPALKGDAFVCACLNANDPLKDMRMVLDECRRMGVNSVSNIGPSISYVDHDSEIYRVMTSAGITLQNEIDMLKLAREEGMVSIGLAFTVEDSLAIVEQARPHIFCYHAGTTKGGISGYDKGETIEETAAKTEEVYQALRKIDPDVILVGHGAAMENPADAQYMLDHTSGHGFWTGSSTERLPIERSVSHAAAEFAALRFGRPSTSTTVAVTASRSTPTVAILATLDTKGDEAAFMRDEIVAQGGRALMLDIGVEGEPAIEPDVSHEEIAAAGGSSIDAIRAAGTRQAATPVIAAGARKILLERVQRGDVQAVLGVGGTQGTSLCGEIMQALPYGLPKVILSTSASGDTAPFVGIKDITMMFAVADILGLNPFMRKMLANAAGAALGAARNEWSHLPGTDSKGTIGMTNLGVLTKGAIRAIDLFHAAGYEVITFHAIGAGGLAMEQMMREGLMTGVFDYAMGEIADWVFDGLRAADEHRLTVAGSLGLPQVVCPGGAEHIGLLLHTPNEPPPAYAEHKSVFHSPVVFAPRLNHDEITKVAHEITTRLQSSREKTVFMIPTKGVSRYSIEGGPLEDREGDAVFFNALKATMPATVDVRELDAAAEDDAFVTEAVSTLIGLIEGTSA